MKACDGERLSSAPVRYARAAVPDADCTLTMGVLCLMVRHSLCLVFPLPFFAKTVPFRVVL